MPWHGRVSKQCERVKIIGSGEERGGQGAGGRGVGGCKNLGQGLRGGAADHFGRGGGEHACAWQICLGRSKVFVVVT